MKRYDSYKDSGIEWIGEIPEHWEVKKIKQFTKVLTGSTPKTTEESYWNGDINWVTTDDLGKLDGMYIFDSRRKISKEGFENSGTNIAPEGSIVISTRAPIGHIGILGIEACTNQGCKTIVSDLNCKSEFLYYHLNTSKEDLNSLGVGTTFLELPTQTLKDYLVPFPNKQEQTSIASFLDRKTAEIDELIADKKRLLELYEEEKTAIIKQAVTKGLNPDVSMKDSGIEWLGEIPEHWETANFNQYVFLRHGYQFRNYDFTPTGLKVIKITQLKATGELEVNDVSFIDESRLYEFKDILIEEGDILMALTGGTIGKIIRVPKINEPLLQNYRVGNFFPKNDSIAKDFLFRVLSSDLIIKQIFFDQRETGQPNIGKEDFGRMTIVLPQTIKEQNEIASFINKEVQRIDSKKARTEELIELLTEYRTALISEAVTGKIKVTED